MSLKVPSYKKIVLNEEESFFVEANDIYVNRMVSTMNQAWQFDQKGNMHASARLYQGANYYTYLFYYGLMIRKYIDRQVETSGKCVALDIEEKFKLSCVEKNLSCLSNTYNVDLVNTWKKLKDLFGITTQSEDCSSECCLGVGEMVLNGSDSCTTFIVGDCEENEEIPPPYGEFFLGEFKRNEFFEVTS